MCNDAELRNDSKLNMEAAREAGLPEGEEFTLANFSYSNSVIVQRVFHYLNNTNFKGITVSFKITFHCHNTQHCVQGNRVQFDQNGNRDINWAMLTQYIPGEQDTGVWYKNTTDEVYELIIFRRGVSSCWFSDFNRRSKQ